MKHCSGLVIKRQMHTSRYPCSVIYNSSALKQPVSLGGELGFVLRVSVAELVLHIVCVEAAATEDFEHVVFCVIQGQKYEFHIFSKRTHGRINYELIIKRKLTVRERDSVEQTVRGLDQNSLWLICPVLSDSLQPQGLQLTRFLCLWNFPGRNARVGYHFFIQEFSRGTCF